MEELVFGHPGFWGLVSLILIGGWIVFWVVQYIVRRHRRNMDDELLSTYYFEHPVVWPYVVTLLTTILVVVLAFVSAVWTRQHTPHDYRTSVKSPETVAVDGTHYVELNDMRKAWTCQPSDQCSELVPGQQAMYTAYIGPDDNWIMYNLRPYVPTDG